MFKFSFKLITFGMDRKKTSERNKYDGLEKSKQSWRVLLNSKKLCFILIKCRKSSLNIFFCFLEMIVRIKQWCFLCRNLKKSFEFFDSIVNTYNLMSTILLSASELQQNNFFLWKVLEMNFLNNLWLAALRPSLPNTRLNRKEGRWSH